MVNKKWYLSLENLYKEEGLELKTLGIPLKIWSIFGTLGGC